MRICIIDCTADKFMVRGMTRRTSSSAYSVGVKCIERDLQMKYRGGALPRVPLADIRGFDIALLPLASVQEVESFVVAAADPTFRANRCKIIAGGFGCVNIYPILDKVDVAVFGRCDNGQINDVIAGASGPNVWRKADDPDLSGLYEVGQFKAPKHTIETGTIGCRMRCLYCQYTHVRRTDNLPYRPERGAAETDIWASDFSTPRVHVTAIDGLSEATRKKVNKPITDELLKGKLVAAFSTANRGKTVGVKLYNIVGYPWETPETVKRDYAELLAMLAGLDRKTGKWKLKITLQNTPFSPEPLTPMECCAVALYDFRSALLAEYAGTDVTVKCTPFFQGVDTRARRVAINRCKHESRHRVARFLRGETGVADVMDVINDTGRPVAYLRRPVQYEDFITQERVYT